MTSFDQPEGSSRTTKSPQQGFHIEINKPGDQTVTAAVVGLMLLETAMIAGRSGTLRKVAQEVAPIFEKGTTSAWTGALRLTNAAPKSTMLIMEDGVELQMSKAAEVFGKKQDLISVVHPTAGEAHLMRDGSRLVNKSAGINLWDEAGNRLQVTFPGRATAGPTLPFDNHNYTPLNKKTFRTLEDCFLIGSTKPLRDVPNLFEQVSRDIGQH